MHPQETPAVRSVCINIGLLWKGLRLIFSEFYDAGGRAFQKSCGFSEIS